MTLDNRTATHVPATRLVWMIAGFLVWSAAFLALYAILSIGCAFGWHEMPLAGPLTVQRTVLVALFLVSLAACVAVLTIARRRRQALDGTAPGLRSFMETTIWLSALAALASTFLSLGPVFFLTACY